MEVLKTMGAIIVVLAVVIGALIVLAVLEEDGSENHQGPERE